ncbi:hypothetical protein [Mesorhizobium sp. AR02]
MTHAGAKALEDYGIVVGASADFVAMRRRTCPRLGDGASGALAAAISDV